MARGELKNKGNNLPLFVTQGSLTFDFAIAPYKIIPFLYFLLYFTLLIHN